MTANNKIEPMRVLYLASEAIPFVKVGGLGDVAGTLPPALRALPAAPDVRLVLPFHNAIDRGAYDLNPITEFSIAHSSGPQPVEVFAVDLHGL
ncbi:MAG: glycogen/starch synthase, partial [Anaerolineae bacterium]|nr:glycogen/starch synthase [Anaerolineae bacterium]